MDIMGNEKARFHDIVLTETGVVQIADRRYWGRASQVFPLDSIDSVFVGWRRSRMLLVAALAAVAAGGGMVVAEARPSGVAALIVGILLGVTFVGYRPTTLRVHSGRSTMNAVVNAAPEAEAFAKLLLAAVMAQRQPKGPIAVYAVHPPGRAASAPTRETVQPATRSVSAAAT